MDIRWIQSWLWMGTTTWVGKAKGGKWIPLIRVYYCNKCVLPYNDWEGQQDL